MTESRSKHVLLVVAVLALTTSFQCHAQAAKPNIIFLMADDQCTYSLGCYGNADVKTPNIDKLADDGIRFDHHYDTTSICMASRANVMTGLLEYKHGCNFDHGPLVREHWNRSYPVLLRNVGYRTAFAGKFGFEVVDAPTDKKKVLPKEDFDTWGGGPGQTHFETAKNESMKMYAKEYPHATRSYGAFGRDFVTESAKLGQPFCLSISFKAPHRPVSPDPIYDDVYAGKTFTKPANFGREFGQHFSMQSRTGRQYDRFTSWNYADKYDEVMAQYHQLCYAIDVAVGMIREAVEKAGVADNTVIIYTSDNGYICGSHGYGSKVLPYEESSRVPMIMFDPRHPNSGKQLTCQALTGNIDFAPTILELAGLPIPKEMDGKSLLSLYENPQATTHAFLPLINVWGEPKCHSLSVVVGHMKYVYWPYAGAGFEPTEELYDLAHDPLELSNVAGVDGFQPELKQCQKAYDDVVRDWSQQAVSHNDYQRFAKLFDRHLSWELKSNRR